MVAGLGIEPRTEAYETSEIPLLYPAIKWSEYKDSNLGPHRPKRCELPGCSTLRMCYEKLGPHIHPTSVFRTPLVTGVTL